MLNFVDKYQIMLNIFLLLLIPKYLKHYLANISNVFVSSFCVTWSFYLFTFTIIQMISLVSPLKICCIHPTPSIFPIFSNILSRFQDFPRTYFCIFSIFSDIIFSTYYRKKIVNIFSQ